MSQHTGKATPLIISMSMNFVHSVAAETMGLTTDHFPLFIKIPCANADNKTKYQTFRKLKDVDMVKFRVELEETLGKMDVNLDFKSMYVF